jgi:hypothetical protein
MPRGSRSHAERRALWRQTNRDDSLPPASVPITPQRRPFRASFSSMHGHRAIRLLVCDRIAPLGSRVTDCSIRRSRGRGWSVTHKSTWDGPSFCVACRFADAADDPKRSSATAAVTDRSIRRRRRPGISQEPRKTGAPRRCNIAVRPLHGGAENLALCAERPQPAPPQSRRAISNPYRRRPATCPCH